MGKINIEIVEKEGVHERELEAGTRMQFRRAAAAQPLPGEVATHDSASIDFLTAAPTVSRPHAELSVNQSGVPIITDLGSRNGTWVRIPQGEPLELPERFEVRLGSDLLIRNSAQSLDLLSALPNLRNVESFVSYLSRQLADPQCELQLCDVASYDVTKLPPNHLRYALPQHNAYLIVVYRHTPDTAVERWLQSRVLLWNSQANGGTSSVRDAEPWDFVGSSPVRREVLSLAKRIARSSGSVLLQGPSGAGKEILARDIHLHSGRRKSSFVAINCAALPETLLEGLLFGSNRGSFTDASDKEGLIEAAHGGTLFLDEIGEMPLQLQPKLLRVLEDRRVRRLGDVREREVDIRIIAATNQNLADMVNKRRFREDLYFRLNTLPLTIPGLLPADVRVMVPHILRRAAKEGFPGIDEGEERQLTEWAAAVHWQGNGRELRSILQRYLTLRTTARSSEDAWQASVSMSLEAGLTLAPPLAARIPLSVTAQRTGVDEQEEGNAATLPSSILDCVTHIDNLLFLAMAKSVLVPFQRGKLAALGDSLNMTGAGASGRLRRLGIGVSGDPTAEQIDAAIESERAAITPYREALRQTLGF